MSSYERVNWENSPSTKTPINNVNLNKMDEGIEQAHNGESIPEFESFDDEEEYETILEIPSISKGDKLKDILSKITKFCNNIRYLFEFIGVLDIRKAGYLSVANAINTIGKDYIVEQETSGIWTYRKWNSGIVECWGKYSAGSYSSGTNTWNNLYFSTIAMVDFPANLFISAPVLNWSASASDFNGSFYKDSYITATKTGAWGLSKPTAFTDIVVYIDIEAKGRWKE